MLSCWAYKPKLKNIIIEGLTVIENSPDSAGADYIRIFSGLDRLVISDVLAVKDKTGGHLLSFTQKGSVGLLVMRDVVANGFDKLIDGEEKITRIISDGVICEK